MLHAPDRVSAAELLMIHWSLEMLPPLCRWMEPYPRCVRRRVAAHAIPEAQRGPLLLLNPRNSWTLTRRGALRAALPSN